MDEVLYPLERLAMFPRYQTREDQQKATGKEPPAYNPNLRPKYWEDPAAATSPKRSILYERVLVLSDSGKPLPGPDGKPQTEPLTLPKAEAAAVNIPPEGTNIEGADAYETPMPLKPLPAGHELCFQFGGVIAVRNVAAWEAQREGFTADDRALQRAIAGKLGV